MKTTLIGLFIVFIAFGAFGMNVQSIQCGLGVKNRKVLKKGDTFKVGDTIYCLSDIRNIKKNTYVIHRWVFNGTYYDIKLDIKPYPRFRTWSYKVARQYGVWKFEVLNKNGKLLKEKILIVKQKGD